MIRLSRILNDPKVTQDVVAHAIRNLHDAHQDQVAVFKTFAYGYLDESRLNIKLSAREGGYGPQYEFIDGESWRPYRVHEPFTWIFSKIMEQRIRQGDLGVLSRFLVPSVTRKKIWENHGFRFEIPEDLSLDLL